MKQIDYRWTDGNNEDFKRFYLETEKYYSQIVGGEGNRTGFVSYNASNMISYVLIAYCDGEAVGCAGLKRYSEDDVEIKRVWVEPDYRGNHIASALMDEIEGKAKEMNYKRAVLQTRPIMKDAVGLYQRRGYSLIENYPPYNKLEGAICMAKEL